MMLACSRLSDGTFSFSLHRTPSVFSVITSSFLEEDPDRYMEQPISGRTDVWVSTNDGRYISASRVTFRTKNAAKLLPNLSSFDILSALCYSVVSAKCYLIAKELNI